ncbi:MAG TPA: DsbC family protein [Syntrophorhabdaceae bacterium]|nr:DsbC family protein [Syntrophorhabdaceae bacterium]
MKRQKTTLTMCILTIIVCFSVSLSAYAAQAKKQPVKKTTPKITESAEPAKIEDVFKKAFPQVPFDSIKLTDIKGIYEVTRGSDIIYFLPENGYVIAGDIINKDGKSLTQQRKAELVADKAKDLPLDKAIKIGNGKNIIVEFTDPDCPYCRKASEYLEQKKDLATRYIFFLPLPMHPDAENKVKSIFCAQDKAKAYEDAMKGKMDDQKYEKCDKPEAVALLNAHKQLAQRLGITGTPHFIINGKKSITGANTPEIEAALAK